MKYSIEIKQSHILWQIWWYRAYPRRTATSTQGRSPAWRWTWSVYARPSSSPTGRTKSSGYEPVSTQVRLKRNLLLSDIFSTLPNPEFFLHMRQLWSLVQTLPSTHCVSLSGLGLVITSRVVFSGGLRVGHSWNFCGLVNGTTDTDYRWTTFQDGPISSSGKFCIWWQYRSRGECNFRGTWCSHSFSIDCARTMRHLFNNFTVSFNDRQSAKDTSLVYTPSCMWNLTVGS